MSLPNSGREPKILSYLKINTKNAPLQQNKSTFGGNYNGVANIRKKFDRVVDIFPNYYIKSLLRAITGYQVKLWDLICPLFRN